MAAKDNSCCFWTWTFSGRTDSGTGWVGWLVLLMPGYVSLHRSSVHSLVINSSPLSFSLLPFCYYLICAHAHAAFAHIFTHAVARFASLKRHAHTHTHALARFYIHIRALTSTPLAALRTHHFTHDNVCCLFPVKPFYLSIVMIVLCAHIARARQHKAISGEQPILVYKSVAGMAQKKALA